MTARTRGATALENRSAPRGRAVADAWRAAGPLLATAVLPFVLVVYLGLRDGGFEEVARGQVGVAIWGIVLVGAVVGILPRSKLTRAGWAAIALLAAFAAWTALSAVWSESNGRSVGELGRVTTYLGALVLALAVQGRDGLRRTAFSVGAAIAVIGVVALLSRLHPAWFPENVVAEEIGDVRSRLAYPLDYWNGLAGLLAMGLPLLVAVAMQAQRVATQALAVAALPALALTLFFTFSRGGILAAAIALGVLIALMRNRLAALPTLATAGIGASLLIASAAQRDALENGLATEVAHRQGDEMLAVTLVVCIGVGLVQGAIGLARRHALLPSLRLSRRTSAGAVAAAACVALVAFLLAGGPGKVGDAFDESGELYGADVGGAQRLETASLSGRNDYWQAALDAGRSDPISGIGAGAYELWWAREGDVARFILDAHSLYLESFAELGIPGVLLILAVVGLPIVVGVRRTLRARTKERTVLAGVIAALVAFAAGAAIDWTWELGVLPVAFFLLAATVLARDARTANKRRVAPRWRLRTGLAGLSAVALVAVGIPLATATAIEGSQREARDGDLEAALDKARTAADIEPYAAAPKLQIALVLERQGELAAARAAAAEATEAEPTDWRNWYVLSGIEEALGDSAASEASFERARKLNPRSPIFSEGREER